MTVAELDARMSPDEYLQWMAFHRWERWKAEGATNHRRALGG